MKQSIFAYVCAPQRNAAQHYRLLYDLGYIPIAPNMMFSRVLSDSVPEQQEACRSMTQALLRRCRVLVVCGEDITEEMEIMLAWVLIKNYSTKSHGYEFFMCALVYKKAIVLLGCTVYNINIYVHRNKKGG